MPGTACRQMPLSFLGSGETATIAKVRGKGDLHHHLENLGFVEGARVTVNGRGGGRPHRGGEGHAGRAQQADRVPRHHERRRLGAAGASGCLRARVAVHFSVTRFFVQMFHVKHSKAEIRANGSRMVDGALRTPQSPACTQGRKHRTRQGRKHLGRTRQGRTLGLHTYFAGPTAQVAHSAEVSRPHNPARCPGRACGHARGFRVS